MYELYSTRNNGSGEGLFQIVPILIVMIFLIVILMMSFPNYLRDAARFIFCRRRSSIPPTQAQGLDTIQLSDRHVNNEAFNRIPVWTITSCENSNLKVSQT